jgi:flagellar motor switch protein FliM
MPDVLSQREIDSLLAALQTGQVSAEDMARRRDDGRVRAYDFKRAMRFSKEQLRSISRIYEHYGRLLATYLSAQLRTLVQMSVASVNQLPYQEFLQSIPETTVLHILDVKPMDGRFVVEVPNTLAAAMLDRLLGGAGELSEQGRPLTEIDMVVLERLFVRSLPTLSSAWAPIADLHFRYESLEVNSQFVQIANQSDVVLVVSMNLEVGETTGVLNVCMPHVVLEPLMPRLTTRFALASSASHERDAGQMATLSRHLDQVTVSVRVDLGSAELTLSQLLSLSAGDVIPLNRGSDDGLDVHVGDELKYRGFPGTHRGRMAIRISEVVEESELGE